MMEEFTKDAASNNPLAAGAAELLMGIVSQFEGMRGQMGNIDLGGLAAMFSGIAESIGDLSPTAGAGQVPPDVDRGIG